MSHDEHIKQRVRDIEAMLPWYVAGTLGDDETRLVEERLDSDPALRKQFELMREELEHSVELSERLGGASPDALSKLMASIAAEPQKAPLAQSIQDRISGWLERVVASFSPVGIGVSAVAAALVICIQAVLLAGLYRQGMTPVNIYQTASKQTAGQEQKGTMALISFVPGTSVNDITGFLLANNLQITTGPRPGGIYTIRIDKKKLDGAALAQRLDKLRNNTAIISFLVPLK